MNLDKNHRDGRLIGKESMKKQRKEESRIHHDEGKEESRREHRHTDQDCLYLRAGDTHR